MRFFKKSGASLARSVVLSLGLFSTHQQTLARTVDTFVEIKGASLLTPGQSGLQVIRLNDRATFQYVYLYTCIYIHSYMYVLAFTDLYIVTDLSLLFIYVESHTP